VLTDIKVAPNKAKPQCKLVIAMYRVWQNVRLCSQVPQIVFGENLDPARKIFC